MRVRNATYERWTTAVDCRPRALVGKPFGRLAYDDIGTKSNVLQAQTCLLAA